MCRPVREPSQGVGELTERFARLRASPSVTDLTSTPRLPSGRGAELMYTVRAARRVAEIRPKWGKLAVDVQRQSVLTVYVGFDYWVPALVEVLLHLTHQWPGVHGQAGRHDQQ